MLGRINLKYLKLAKEDLHNNNNEAFWGKICWHYNLDEDFVREFKDKINFEYLQYNAFSESFLDEFQDRIYWCSVPCSIHQQLSDNFIIKYQDKLNWNAISFFKNNFSEEFIEKFKDKISWIDLSLNKTIPENIIRRYKTHLNLSIILKRQNLSPGLRYELELER